MPKLLVIDTSAGICGVGLSSSGNWRQLESLTPRQAAQEVLGLIDSILVQSELTLRELDAIAITTGPGSFTGLRIGIGIVQGLAEAASIPVIPVSNLALCAYGHLTSSSAEGAAVCLSARDGESYFALYESCSQRGVRLQGAEKVISVADQQNVFSLMPLEEKWLLVGDGWDEGLLNTRLITIADNFTEVGVSLKHLSDIAEKYLAAKLWLKPEQLQPNYVKEELGYLS